MILVRNIKTALGQPESEAVAAACRKLGVRPAEIVDAYVTKTSVDARKRGHILKVSTVAVRLRQNEERAAKKAGGDAQYKKTEPFAVKKGTESLKTPVVIAGFGPAGMFAAELLAREGYRPIVVERGCDVDRRVREVEGFWTTGSSEIPPATSSSAKGERAPFPTASSLPASTTPYATTCWSGWPGTARQKRLLKRRNLTSAPIN